MLGGGLSLRVAGDVVVLYLYSAVVLSLESPPCAPSPLLIQAIKDLTTNTPMLTTNTPNQLLFMLSLAQEGVEIALEWNVHSGE